MKFNSIIYVMTFLLGMVPPLPQINGYTHWSVTPNGMIVPITTSFFHLRQPWNLLKLFNQETNCHFINSADIKLNQVSDNLQSNQNLQKDVHKHYIDSNSACVKASKLLTEYNLYSTHILTLEAKGIQSQAYLNESLLKNSTFGDGDFSQPFCDQFFQKPFSLCCFDHLDAIRNRSNYIGVPEISLYKVAFPQHLTPTEYGYLVSMALAEYHKSTSHNWILYNMAAFYWRVKGSSKNAIECLRAALHTSPSQYLDIALVSLTNVLQLIKSASKDALILMENAVLVSPHFSSHHIILGNIFAGFGKFNDSLYHFELAAELYKSDTDKIKLKDIEERIFAARCSHELSVAISEQQTALKKQLQELESIQYNSELYHNTKVAIDDVGVSNATQKRRQEIYEAYLAYEEQMASSWNHCSMVDFTKQLVPCQSAERNVVLEVFKNAPSTESLKPETKTDENPPLLDRQYQKLFPNDKQRIQLIDCQSIQCFGLGKNKNNDRYMSINLSPRNKGFDLLPILTTRQGLANNQEHPLPWHPPHCAMYVDKTRLLFVDVVDNITIVKPAHDLKNTDEHNRIFDQTLFLELKKLVNNSNIRLEDIGQRIVSAMANKLAPIWIVLNIAGLYWRVMGNHHQALDCLRLSAKMCPLQYRDVPIVNMASVILKFNQSDDAMQLVKVALQIDYSEPVAHLLIGGLYKRNENYDVAYQHFSIAISQEPHLEFAELEMNVIKCQLCIKQQVAANSDLDSEYFHATSKVFQKYNMCTSARECQNIISNKCHHLPHIKIDSKGESFSHTDIDGLSGSTTESILQDDSTSGQIMYGFLWNTNASNLYILDHDCIVTNDSIRTAGCHLKNDLHEASSNAAKFLEELKCVLHHLSQNNGKYPEPGPEIQKHHSCHIEHSGNLVDFDKKQYAAKPSAPAIHDEIIKLISSRVVLSPLAPEDCEQVAPFDFKTYTPLYVSLNTMQVNAVALLDSITPSYTFAFSQNPHCSPKGDNVFLQNVLEQHNVDFDLNQYSKVPEYNLHASFLKTFDDKYTLEEIGKRLYTGLMQNSSDWRLATIVMNYWRVYGDAGEAFKCLQVAMETSPDFHLKVILVNAANILYRINKLEAALEVSYRALKCPDGQKWIVIPFLVANIFASMEQWQKAILFYESCLSIKSNFEEAIYRIKSIQCQQMVLQNLEQH